MFATHLDTSISPLEDWKDYFDACQDVKINTDIFRVYISSAQVDTPNRCLLILLHGAGHAALSWALAASQLRKMYDIVSIDLRGHGHSSSDDESNLSINVLVQDVISILKIMYPNKENTPKMIIAGHSLGGSIAVHVTSSGELPIVGCAVLDMVEGIALQALPFMKAAIQKRPSQFSSMAACIAWHSYTGVINNSESARVSVPSMLIDSKDEIIDSNSMGRSVQLRTDLLQSEKHWKSWFIGLSELFLSLKVPTILMLSSVEKMDTPLIRAHMQGKFQLCGIPRTGHFVHEDNPSEVSRLLSEFIGRCLRY